MSQTFDWQFFPASQSMQLTGFSRSDELLVFASAGTVYVLEGTTGEGRHPGYSIGSVARRPVFAKLLETATNETHLFLFATGSASVYKFDVTTSVPTGPLQIDVVAGQQQVRDLRRAACPNDGVIAEPVVQRRAESGPGFTLNADIVMVATAHACGDTTQNTVFALDAANVRAPPLWTFNSGEYEVGLIRSCRLDLTRNRLYCGSDVPTGSFQPGLWAINTNDGSLAWAGSLATSVPVLSALSDESGSAAGRVYVGDATGRVTAIDVDDGLPVGSAQLLPVGTPVSQDLAVGSGIYAGFVWAVDGDRRLNALFDTGAELLEAWQSSFPGGQGLITPATPQVARGKLYVGATDGRFYQLTMSSGSIEASGAYGVGGSGRVISPLLLYRAADGGDRLVGAEYNIPGGTVVRQYRVPCATPSAQCTLEDFVFSSGFE